MPLLPVAPPSAPAPPAASPPAPSPPAAAPASPPAALLGLSEDVLSSVLREYEALGRKSDMGAALGGLVSQMLSREVLAPPLRALCAAFPRWLASARGALSDAEYAQRGLQYQCYQRLCLVYATEPAAFAKLASLVQEAARYGPPPAALVAELGGGLTLAADGRPQLPGLPAACGGGGASGEEQQCAAA